MADGQGIRMVSGQGISDGRRREASGSAVRSTKFYVYFLVQFQDLFSVVFGKQDGTGGLAGGGAFW
jgi:hypothetical protein